MPDTPIAPRASTGLEPNVAGALAYLLLPLTGLLFLALEKESRFVRFHAAQAIGVGVVVIGVNVALAILSMVLTAIPFLGWMIAIALFLVSLALGLGVFVLWLFLMYRAYGGHEWEVPVIGEQVRRYLGGATAVAPRE